MGYRNYFAIVEKERADQILNATHDEQFQMIAEVIHHDYSDAEYAEELLNQYKEDDVVEMYMLKQYMQPHEIIECGKYFDDDVSHNIKQNCRDYSDEDTEFCIVQPEALLICAEHYRDKTVKYYNNMIRSLSMTDEECKEDKDMGYRRPDVTSLCRHLIYDLQQMKFTKDDVLKRESLIYSWQYEYDMFNLLHFYKTIDWNKYYLIWMGY